MYGRASAFLLLFDLSRHDTFTNLDKLIQEVDKYAKPEALKFLVGCKSDIVPHQVRADEIAGYSETKGFQYFEVSAQNGSNIEALGEAVCRAFIAHSSK